MMLIDYSGVIFADVFVTVNQCKGKEEFSKEFFRNTLLTHLHSIDMKFRDLYGEFVICMDSHNCWRRDIFPNYKNCRKKQRLESGIDWDRAFKDINDITEEFMDVLPYKFIKVDRLEGDDVIAIMVEEYHDKDKHILIVSNDKDLKQLHKYKNIRQYFPQKKIVDRETDPEFQLLELTLHGDSIDGIPNILSDINSFVIGKRQNPLRKSYIKKIYQEGLSVLTEAEKKRYDENNILINLSNIPSEYYPQVVEQYTTPQKKFNQYSLFNYFAKSGLKELICRLDEFMPLNEDIIDDDNEKQEDTVLKISQQSLSLYPKMEENKVVFPVNDDIDMFSRTASNVHRIDTNNVNFSFDTMEKSEESNNILESTKNEKKEKNIMDFF